MNNRLLLSLILTLSSLQTYAQLSQGGMPPSFDYTTNLRSIQTSIRSIPVNIDVDRLKWEDEVATRNGTALRVAVTLPTDIDIARTGVWTTLPDSTQIWRQSVEANGALGLIVSYSDFYIPRGGKLYLYNKDKTQVLGAYTNETHPSGGAFANEIILGDSFTLEYVASKMSMEYPRLKINDLGYVYTRSVNDQTPQLNSDYTDRSGFNQSGCRVNINCIQGDNWQNQKRGVVLYFIKRSGRWDACTGSLVNNTNQDGTPYLLSAAHCFDGEIEYSSVIAYFNMEFPTCTNETVAPAYQTLVGVSPLVEIPLANGSDQYLVKFNNNIPESYQPYFNGWDIQNIAPKSGVVIHHPNTDVKKISTYTTSAKSEQFKGSSAREIGAKNAHWEVAYISNNSTEPGSSGSPLFNQDGLIVGTLTGGDSYCEAPAGADYYGKLWFGWNQATAKYTYDNKLQTYLDPTNLGLNYLKGYDPYRSGIEGDVLERDKIELVLFPNPTENELNVNANSVIRKIEVRNLQGRKVFSSEGYGASTAVVPTESLVNGVYLIQIETDGKKLSGKFIKK